MKWIAIAGTWNGATDEIKHQVYRVVTEMVNRGDGIVSGGALGVDYFALEQALQLNPSADRIKIFLPSIVERYADHYRKRVKEGVITERQAEDLIAQLGTLKQTRSSSIIENRHNSIINRGAYFDRITQIVEAADELIVFQINGSSGTQDTIDKAKKKGIPVKVYSYTV